MHRPGAVASSNSFAASVEAGDLSGCAGDCRLRGRTLTRESLDGGDLRRSIVETTGLREDWEPVPATRFKPLDVWSLFETVSLDLAMGARNPAGCAKV